MKLENLFLIFTFILAIACEKEVIITPDPALLIGPVNNNSCTSETIYSSQKSQVNFRWQSALNADEYQDNKIRDIQTIMTFN